MDMESRTNFAMMQAFGFGVRAIVNAIQATGPKAILPKFGRGPITNPLPDLTEDEVRKEIWGYAQNHLRNMQETIDFIGNRIGD